MNDWRVVFLVELKEQQSYRLNGTEFSLQFWKSLTLLTLFDFFFLKIRLVTMHRCESVHVPSNYIILFEVNRATSRAVIVFGYRNEKNLNEISSNQKGVIVLRNVSD